MSRINDYIALTKPSIMLLVLFTGASAMVMEGSLLHRPGLFLLVLLGLYLTGGAANALNMYLERDIDSRMSRTAKRRPLPTGRLRPAQALTFAIAIGVIGVLIFWYFFNLLTAALSLSTILFYGFFYTLYLKPNTPQNIVIGGIAGAMAPVGAWTAATGEMAVAPWILFLIIFFWTPPHFWVLAQQCEDDYRRARLPMMPLVAGKAATNRQILAYTVILFGVSLSLVVFGAGWLYGTTAVGLGGFYLIKTVQLYRSPRYSLLRSLFGFSLLYLFGLFTAVIVDRLMLA